MSEKIAKLDRGYAKVTLDGESAVTKDLVETVDTELKTLGYDTPSNAIYEFKPYILPRCPVRLLAVRVVEVDGEHLEQKVEFGCGIDDDNENYYLLIEGGEGEYRMYPVEPDGFAAFTMFHRAALDRIEFLN